MCRESIAVARSFIYFSVRKVHDTCMGLHTVIIIIRLNKYVDYVGREIPKIATTVVFWFSSL